MKSRLYGIICAVVIVILDQVSKAWILSFFNGQAAALDVLPFFRLVLTWNTGVSFGFFNNGGGWNVLILSSLAALVCLILFIWLWRSTGLLIPVALGCIIGGAVGNVIDRIQIGAVVDFLDFYAFGYHWPAFNLADTPIMVGAALLIWDSLFCGKNSPRN